MASRVRSWSGRALALALGCAAALAQAHDSWLSPVTAASSRRLELALSTGERYPLASSAPPAASLTRAGCVDARGAVLPLRAGRERAAALSLQAGRRNAGPAACWIELKSHDALLTPQLVELYLREIRPPLSVRQAWIAQQESGVAWQERYRKFARIEQSSTSAAPASLRAIRRPQGLDLEIVVLGDAPLRSGQAARFQVLSRGAPVAGLAVELVSERSPLGVWRHSDDSGQLAHTIPFAGAWLLRATLLEPGEQPGQWQSRFVTLTFEVM